VKKYGKARQGTDDNLTRHMCFACWITKATNTLRIFNTYCFTTAKMVTQQRLNITLHIHCRPCWFWEVKLTTVKRGHSSLT